MVWNAEGSSTGRIKIVVKSESENTYEYAGTENTITAVRESARQSGIRKFSVYAEDGRELDEDEANKALSEVGNLEVVEEMVAAF